MTFIDNNNPNFKHGKYSKSRDFFCLDCNKKLNSGTAKRCNSCAGKYKIVHGKSQKKYFCIDCGIGISDYRHNYCIKCVFKGNRSYKWIDGRSYLPYSQAFTTQLKLEIRTRDNFECKNCHMTEEEHLIVVGTNLHIHHIDYNKQNCDEKNLITACLWCNLRANSNRQYWQEYYTKKVNEYDTTSHTIT